MRAEQGKTYAQILNGKCHWIFTAEDLPEWNDDHILVVDVTGDIPSIGDVFLGGVFEPVETVQPPAPMHCSRRQGRLALLANGLLDDVEALIAAIPDDTQRRAAQIEYEADTWERSNPTLRAMWAQLGGTEAGLDALFIDARGR